MLTGTCLCEAASWTLEGDPGPITACNCTICRRYGVLWAYDHLNERIRLHGPMAAFRRRTEKPIIDFKFCAGCGCVLAWQALMPYPDGRVRAAVNVRLAPPEAVADLPIEHFDGLTTLEHLPRDGRRVRDLWF